MNVKVRSRPVGRLMLGERIDVTPLSMSFTPTLLPAVAPVTKSKLPLTVVPSCLGPLELVSSGLARSH